MDALTQRMDSEGLHLPSPLRAYQREGIGFLLERDSALLADEMGLGKTVQAAVALSLLLRTGGRSRALIVAPASLRLNWEEEIRRWAADLSVRIVRGDAEERRAHYRLPFNVLIASYEQVRADSISELGGVRFDVAVLDEAQRIKNAGSETALACRLVRRNRSWALTGTPIENAVSDLVSVFRFIRPGLLRLGMSRPETHHVMRPHFLRRRKADVLPELPSIITQDLPLELEGRQREAYQRAWAGRATGVGGLAESSPVANMLAAITRLKQICNFDRDSNESAKMDALQVIIEGLAAEHDKLLVFSQFVETLQWIADQIGDQLPCDVFHGGLDEEPRHKMVVRFNNEPGPRVLLMSLRAGGLGLNLQGASTLVLFDRWWNPAVEEQAIHRAHRFGRELPLHVYRFLVADTVEERIAEILEAKRDVFERYVESAESAPTSAFTRADLACILRLD